MAVSGRTSKISSIIATLCIFIYIVAIAFGAVQIIENNGQRRSLAEKEFYDLTDRASSSAVILGFMSEAYRETIKDFIAGSETLLGVIITGSDGEFAFERYQGSGIVWSANSPRFKTGAGFIGEPFLLYLRIEGQRNVTIQAIYSPFESALILKVLRNTLLAVLAALAIALITLLVEITFKKKTAYYQSEETDSTDASDSTDENVYLDESAASEESTGETRQFVPDRVFVTRSTKRDEYPTVSKWVDDPEIQADAEGPDILPEAEGPDIQGDAEEPEDFQTPFDKTLAELSKLVQEREPEIPVSETILEEKPPVSQETEVEIPWKDLPIELEETPQGLFSPRSNIGWESYTRDRLTSELHRCASSEQDLVFIAMDFRGTEGINDTLYRQIADEAVSLFGLRDLIFERGGRGLSVIVPGVDLDHGIGKSEDFRNRIIARMAESLKDRIESPGAELCIGLSSRSGRLLEADRMMLESSRALEKALEDPASPIMAFKSDPEKYREYLKGHQKNQ